MNAKTLELLEMLFPNGSVPEKKGHHVVQLNQVIEQLLDPDYEPPTIPEPPPPITCPHCGSKRRAVG